MSPVFFTLILVCTVCSANASIEGLQKTLQRYQSSSSVEAKVDKQVKLSLLEKTESSSGKFYYAKGKFRLELNDDQKTLIVLDGTTLWIASKLVDFDGQWQVAKTSSRSLKKSQAIMGFLFDKKSVWKDFEVKSEKTEGDNQTWVLKPKKQAETEITKLQIKADVKNNKILQVSYWDNLENETQYSFKSQKFGSSIASSKFSYKPPKGAEVTEF